MKLFTKLFLFLVAVTISLTSNTVVAQSEESGRLDIEEIIVTGTKRDISQQDVPVAVSTLTAKQLDNTFRNDVFALGQLAPNVTLTPQNGFNAIAGGMRGTGFISILVTKDPSVGVVVDDFAFNHVQAQAIEMFDMEQVEIYRGPQGTLFGKNTTGGALSFTTKKTSFGRDIF
jgi:iron complex outermembrane receptor protein